ncbi:hypothetical protein M0R45_019069 [Rubus argutus]|uniref:NAC domain-containing protein n=1 Tax=Rubus argutus TaxID=59490 RepID=A0AAW1X4U3_RUBAR
MENYSEAAIVTNNGSDLHGGHLGSYDSFFATIPPGYRFKPFDTELVVYYLKRKIANQTLPPNRIREVELYNFSPDTLAARILLLPAPGAELGDFLSRKRDCSVNDMGSGCIVELQRR